MLVSLFTDASFCPNMKVGGYGIWTRCGKGKVEASGPMRRVLRSSNEAECRAVFAGLLLIAQQPWEDVTRILVQSESDHAIHLIHTKSQHKTLEELEDEGFADGYGLAFIGAIRTYEQDHRLIIMGRKLEGHLSFGTHKRKWANNRTDKLAREGLVIARAWFEGEQS